MRLVVDKWSHLPQRRSAGGLDLDNVGTHVAEHLSAKESALGSEIQNPVRRKHLHHD
jgi:hypothetical protein